MILLVTSPCCTRIMQKTSDTSESSRSHGTMGKRHRNQNFPATEVVLHSEPLGYHRVYRCFHVDYGWQIPEVYLRGDWRAVYAHCG